MFTHPKRLHALLGMLLAGLAVGVLSAGLALAKKPPKPPPEPPPAGTVYLLLGGQMHTMDPDGSNKEPLPKNFFGEPSYTLHGGYRWFLQHREIPGEIYPSGAPREELFAVREDGDEQFAVQLTDDPSLEKYKVRWATDAAAAPPAEDGVVSWVARRWDLALGQVVQAGIYDAQIEFDANGNVSGPVADPIDPLVPLGLVENDYDGLIDDPDIEGFDWSPHGTALVYATAPLDPDFNAINVVDFDPDGQDYVVTVGGWDPVWSPAGGKIAFDSTTGIETINLDGTDRQTIIPEGPQRNGIENPGTPLWSPSGGHVVYEWFELTVSKYRSNVYRASKDGANITNLTKLGDGNFASPVGWR